MNAPRIPTPFGLAALLAATLVWLAAPPADATTVIRAGLPELSDRAGLVVEGDVIATGEYTAVGGMVYTDYTVRVAHRYKGPVVAEVVVRLPGGGGTTVVGTPKLMPESRVLLFLERGNVGDTWVVLGLGQGHFVLERDAFRRQMGHVGFLDLGYCTGGESLTTVPTSVLRAFLTDRFGGLR